MCPLKQVHYYLSTKQITYTFPRLVDLDVSYIDGQRCFLLSEEKINIPTNHFECKY